MARKVFARYRVTGRLQTRSALHVGGAGAVADTDLPLARDGRGRIFVPGTSLAGALRNWCDGAFGVAATANLWGPEHRRGDGDGGAASFITVMDAVIEAPEGEHMLGVEIRDGVGIDRRLGTAAREIKFDRAVLPSGTLIGFALILDASAVDDPGIGILGHLIAALQAGEVLLGAARTRGLGQVALIDCKLLYQELATATGILETLRRGGRLVDPATLAATHAPPGLRPRLDFTVQWRARLPVMVKAGHEGNAVDILPMVSGDGRKVSLVLPGSSLKGALRSHAERILRTLHQTDADEDFERQLVGEPLIRSLFGTPGTVDPAPLSEPGDQVRPGLAALRVEDCRLAPEIERENWAAIETAPTLPELVKLLETQGLNGFQPAQHVAIDRWTGGAAEGQLFSVLEPHIAGSAGWSPLRLGIALDRLASADRVSALVLLLLLLRDLRAGRLPIGFGTNRGLGEIEITGIELVGTGLVGIPLVEAFEGTQSWGEMPDPGPLQIPGLQQAWHDWLDPRELGSGP